MPSDDMLSQAEINALAKMVSEDVANMMVDGQAAMDLFQDNRLAAITLANEIRSVGWDVNDLSMRLGFCVIRLVAAMKAAEKPVTEHR